MDHLTRIKKVYIITLTSILVISELILNLVTIKSFENQMLETIFEQNKRQLNQVFKSIQMLADETNDPKLIQKFITNVAKNSYQRTDSFICFLDSTGTIIAHGNSEMVGKNMSSAYVYYNGNKQSFKGAGGVVSGEMNSDIVSSSYNDQLHLNVSTHEDKKQLEERVSELQRQFILSGLILFGLLLVVGLQLSSWFVGKYIKQIEEYEGKIIEDNQKLTLLNEQLEDYSTIVSHDVASPLAIMTMSLNLMMLKIDDENQEITKPYSDKIMNAVTHIKDLTQNLLQASKITEGEFSLQPIELDDVIDSISKLYNSETTEIKKLSSFPAIKLDKARIEVVFNNIISNGLKYNDSDQKLIQFEYRTTDDKHIIIISDNGIGIEKSELKKIFDKFYRSTNKGTEEGHGVGLHMVMKIIKMMKGEISVSSKVSVGTHFEITFPT